MLATFVALALGALGFAQGFEIPVNDGWVTDRAGFLAPSEEQALEALMESYRAGSGQEIALLTVPDLGGRSIEEFALGVARAWKIGDRETSSGALLVVARAERELRIEVGRGLEGTLTDSIAGRIIRDVIVPEFREGRFPSGLRLGIEAIHAALGGDYGTLERGSGDVPAALLILLMVVVVLMIRSIVKHGRRATSRRSSMLPWILASQIGSSTRRGGGSFGGSSHGFGGGGFRGFGGGGGFSGGGASGRW